MIDKHKKKVATARVIFISDGHVTEVEAALCRNDFLGTGYTEQEINSMTTKDIHHTIIGETFAAGASKCIPSKETGYTPNH